MKKIYTLMILLSAAMITSAQTIDFTKDGRHYYSASPNGKYYIGTTMGDDAGGVGCFFNAETKEHMATDSAKAYIIAVSNDGDAVGSYFGYASIWHQGKEWEKLPGINGQEFAKGEIIGISRDGKKLMTLVEISENNPWPIMYTKKGGEWTVSKLPAPKKDDVYKMAPQFLTICGMNYDGTRVFGRYVTADGQREVPFVWDQGKAEAGDQYNGWKFRFLVSKSIVRKGVKVEDVQAKEDFRDVLEYQVYRLGIEAGILFDMSPYSEIAYCGSGKYLPLNVKVLNAEENYDSYAGVIDVDKDSLIIIKSVIDGGTLSVNDKDELMVYSPAQGTFRDSYVVSLNNIEKAETLTEYTKRRTDGNIDLAKYMTYQRIDTMVVAAGSATWATEGNAFVTFNYDEQNENNVPHCYMVRFTASAVGVENVEYNEIGLYPNPTNGILNFEDKLENIEVYDLTGRKVYSQKSAIENIDLTRVAEGTYVVVAEKEGKRITEKILITK